MSSLIIKNKGIQIDNYYIPPFELNEGEIIVIRLLNNENYFEMEMFLKDIFIGNIHHKNTIITKESTFVNYIQESEFRRIFLPITVGEYLKKHSNINNPYTKKIYDIDWINKRTKISYLPWNLRRLLSLYSVFSKTKNIIIDFAGQDTQGIEFACNIILKEVNERGSAIIFDITGCVKNDNFKYIQIEKIEESKIDI